jgi:hypothetical protein
LNPEYGPFIIPRNDPLKNCICPRPLNSTYWRAADSVIRSLCWMFASAGAIAASAVATVDCGPHQHGRQRVVEQPAILKPAHPELVDQRIGLVQAALEDDRPLQVQGRKRARQDDRRVLETDPRRPRHGGIPADGTTARPRPAPARVFA